nr:hypothetical protein [Tanacetum cinerariifolium]
MLNFLAITITLDLPTVDPEDSLRMGDEHFDTILERESDEFIKSSVENLVPSLSESKNLSDAVDPEDSLRMGDEHFDTILERESDEFIKSSVENLVPSLSESKNLSDGIYEADCDPEEEIRLIKNLLYDNLSPRPLEEFISKNSDVAIESFSPSHIPIEDKFLINDSLSLPENESFHFDIPSSPRPPAKPPDDDDDIEPNSEILTVKVVGDISEQYVHMPRLLPTQPTLASNHKKSPHLLSHRGLKAFQLFSTSLMMIYGGNIPILDVTFLHFYNP